jgi:hypothetical protein
MSSFPPQLAELEHPREQEADGDAEDQRNRSAPAECEAAPLG